MESVKVLRWGICGTGKISHDFCVNLRTLPEEQHKVVAVAGRSLDRAKEFASRFSVAKAYGSYEQLAQDNDVDIVYVGTIHPTHYDCCMKMFEYNKHILCEKPMTMSAIQTKQLIETAQNKRLFLMEAMWYRMSPFIAKLKELIANGAIGEVKLLNSTTGFIAPTRIDRLYNPELGGGATLDIGIYPIAMASLVFGGGRPESIKANGYLTDTGVDELVSVIIKYPGNKVAQLSYSFNLDLPNETIARGSKGSITLTIPLFKGSPSIQTPVDKFEFLLPDMDMELNYPTSKGLSYEAAEARRCIIEGKIQSDAIPLKESLIMAEIMDEIMKQLGVK